MADQPKSIPRLEGNALRETFLVFIEQRKPHAALRAFGELLDDLSKETNLLLHRVDERERDSAYARRHLDAAATDLRHVVESLCSLSEFRDEIDDARAAVAAHDAVPALERVADALEGTFGPEA